MKSRRPLTDSRSRKLRWQFYDTVLALNAPDVETTYQNLCDAWVTSCEADWAWLWLLDNLSATKRFQLVGVSTGAGTKLVPRDFNVAAESSVAALCLEKNRAVVVEGPLADWSEEYQGRQYQVGLQSSLSIMECAGFVAIPVVVPRQGARKKHALQAVVGVICVHWRENKKWIGHEEYPLGLMGRLTARVVRAAHRARVTTITTQISDIAQRHVTDRLKAASDRRSMFVEQIVDLLKSTLSLGGVSIFYENEMLDCVECLGTTGMLDANGERIERLEQIRYVANEGFTGTCYARALPLIMPIHGPESGNAKFSEEFEGGLSKHPASLMYPILRGAYSRDDFGSPLACGVIRCAFHSSSLFPGKLLPFDCLEIECVDFVAKQIAPILAGMTSSIWREFEQRRIAHDVNQMLSLMGNTLRAIEEDKSNTESQQRATKPILNLRLGMLMLNSALRRMNFTKVAPTMLKGDVPTLLQRVVEPLCHYAAIQRGMKIELFHEASWPSMKFDEGMTESVFVNILMNAIKYGAERSTIAVNTKATPMGYLVDFVNDGDRIPQEEASNLFYPGYRASNSTIVPGTGMGLAIAKRFMTSQGGDIILVPDPTLTVFRVSFPLAAAHSPHDSWAGDF